METVTIMNFLKRKFEVYPNTMGYLYRKNRLYQVLEPGVYYFYDFDKELFLVSLPTIPRVITVFNQEVLTSDNIAFRFSFFITYRIADGESVLENAGSFESLHYFAVMSHVEQMLHLQSQVLVRNMLAGFNSDELIEKRASLSKIDPLPLQEYADRLGLVIEEITLRDITFPKQVQNLFAKQLEAKVRAQTDLENARTAVATARALKNAATLMKDNEQIQFLQLLETLNKLADKGKHTFVLGDILPFNKS